MAEKRAVTMSRHKRGEHTRNVLLESMTIQCSTCGNDFTFLHYPGSFHSMICDRPDCQDALAERKRQENRERVARHRAQKRGLEAHRLPEHSTATQSMGINNDAGSTTKTPAPGNTFFALLDTIPTERTGIMTWAKNASRLLSIPTEQLTYRLALHRDALNSHGVRLSQSTRHRTLFIPTLGEDSGAYYSHIWREKPIVAASTQDVQ